LQEQFTQKAFDSGVARVMKRKDRIGEREHEGHLKSLRTNTFNTQLQPLRSLKTATKKRRELRKQADHKFRPHENKPDAIPREARPDDGLRASPE
jgi:hypothetical protein